jgi:extracellular factor (EF) 3-hydroxypalmitic acid methyl ester biosynthesis protein
MEQLTAAPVSDSAFDEAVSMVSFKTSQGLEAQATLIRLTPQSVSFEIYNPLSILRVSEVLTEFKILADDRPIYSGKATITSIFNTGMATACEAALTTPLPGLDLFQFQTPEKVCLNGFNAFLSRWQKTYLVNHDYKVVIADLQAFLSSLRLWLEQVELTLQSSPAAERGRLESEITQGLRGRVTSALSNIFERFETVAERIDPELQPVHRAFGQRQLHPHLLCAPFIHRTYTKPLGYAGDYEMMNMIVRNGLEGNSLYAKLTNAYLLDQVGPQAVRNRVDYLQNILMQETARVARHGRTAKIYSIACGPAREAQNFVAGHAVSNHARFDLLDFNAETLTYAGARMDDARNKHHRKTEVKLIRKSVHQLLKEAGKTASKGEGYDLIYCSGLYDYLSDRVIKALNTYFYDQLVPGGLLTVGNFAPNTPVRNFIEHFLEWFLIYRDGRQLAALAPQQASPADCRVIAEPTGTNIFLEVRKPL